jgi:hypothetical protein
METGANRGRQTDGQEAADALDAGRRPPALLQISTRVLNNDLAADFHRWYPGFTSSAEPAAEAA